MTTHIDDLMRPAAFPHPVVSVRLVETHISWVLLTGEFAYKIKKPVDFGFLDFSTLALRKTFCDAEVMLNRRFAPALYLDVVPVTSSAAGVRIGGDGVVVDWAVMMRQFPDEAQMDVRLRSGEVGPADFAAFADYLAGVHAGLPSAAEDSPYGTAAAVMTPVRENFEAVAGTPFALRDPSGIAALDRWSRDTHVALTQHFAARRADGFVRECHGDLHLSNLVWLEDRAVAFDCLEFNPGLRWIDVLSDAAFLVMDLETRGRGDLAHAFLDRYLERTGDYRGARALNFYLVYRSIVRGKVAALQAQGGSGALTALAERFDLHIAYAAARAFATTPLLVITWGVSGSGKSWVAERLVTRLPAIRLRSDVERKRLQGLTLTARVGSAVAEGLYSRAVSEATYRRLEESAVALLEAGVTVIVDATFLEGVERERFRALAERLGARFRILACVAPEPVLIARVRARQRASTDPSDADERVLRAQLAGSAGPPAGSDVVTLDTSQEPIWDRLLERLGEGSRSA